MAFGVLSLGGLTVLLSLLLQYKNVSYKSFRETETKMSEENRKRCGELRENLTSQELPKEIDVGRLAEDIKKLRTCPWEQDFAVLNRYRTDLNKCSNLTQRLVLTRENAPIGHEIEYEVAEQRVRVEEPLFKLLPRESPFKKAPYKRCAVVGNAGILLNSGCGRRIDQADFVFRCNLPPLNYSKDVGSKTDLVTANPSIIIQKYHGLKESRRLFVERMKVYKDALILMAAFSQSFATEISLAVAYALEDFGSKQKAIFFHPAYLRQLGSLWRSWGVRARRLSSGLMLVSAALELCDSVALYGFWPFSTGLDGEAVLHHYYDNVPPEPGVHAMSSEFVHYLQMHSKGVLQLHVGKCL
uniref:ST8 alpha-N-acetyl-neuraminide alpha-2,8-sialyltransferase 6 n=1 Tax=Latimeria chalumnae TaxID=7897 RepID=H3B4B4_LATCH